MARTPEDAQREVNEWRLGKTSEFYETGGRGPGTISTGKNDHGGVSYGSYQLATGPGTLQEYLDQSSYSAAFEGLVPKTPAFNTKWKELATTDPAFAIDQHDFIMRSHYGRQVERLQEAGLDLSDRGRAVHDAIWSTSVQYRELTKTIFTKALEEKHGKDYDLSTLPDQSIIEAVQDYKVAHNNTLFRSSPNAWPGLLDRARDEKAELLQLADSEALMALSGQYRDWRLGPAPPSDTRNAWEQYQSNTQHFREGNFAAYGASAPPPAVQPPIVHTPTSVPASDPMLDGTLRPGERGAAVAKLQQDLNARAMEEGRQSTLGIDQMYGRDTRQAVENFQLWNGLPTTGVADEATLATLAGSKQKIAPADSEDAADINRHDELRSPSISEPVRDPARPSSSTQLSDPRATDHPDYPLHQQIRGGVGKLHSLGGQHSEGSDERMSLSLLGLAKQTGITRVDEVVLNVRTNTHQAGETVFLVQGSRSDPAMHRQSMPVEAAMQAPVETSLQQIETLNQKLALQSAQQQDISPVKAGPSMSM